MTTLYTVSTGDRVQAADLNQYKSMLEGASGYTSTYLMVSSTGTNFILQLGDAVGTNKLSVKNSAGVEKFSVSSTGAITGTSLSVTSFTLPTAASPSQTTEGELVWDTDDDVLTIGTGAATKRLGLTRGAGANASATAELVYDTTAAKLKAWNGAASVDIGPISGLTLIASNTSEQTSTVAANTTLVTLTPATAVATTGLLMLVVKCRKSSGAAAAAHIGITVNSTAVYNTQTNPAFTFSATDRAEDGMLWMIFAPGTTNYLNAMVGIEQGWVSSSHAQTGVAPSLLDGGSAAMPAATITQVLITGSSSSASVTVAVKDCYLYSLAVS